MSRLITILFFFFLILSASGRSLCAAQEQVEPVLVNYYRVILVTDDFNKASRTFYDLVRSLKGTVMTVSFESNKKEASAQALIPRHSEKAFIEELSRHFTVKAQNSTKCDYTPLYANTAQLLACYEILSGVDIDKILAGKKVTVESRLKVKKEFTSWVNINKKRQEEDMQKYKVTQSSGSFFLTFQKPLPPGELSNTKKESPVTLILIISLYAILILFLILLAAILTRTKKPAEPQA